MKKIIFLLTCSLFVFASCGKPTEEMIQTAIEETKAAETDSDPLNQSTQDESSDLNKEIERSDEIVFDQGEDALWGDLYKINADGRDLVKLFNRQEFNFNHSGHPTWSPDGTQIAFSALVGSDSHWEIWRMDMESGELEEFEDAKGGMNPSWSPEGTKLAFVVWENNADIRTINFDGSGLRTVIEDSANDTDPDWSPDGSKIVFSSDRDGEDGEIYIMSVLGSDITQLTDNQVNEFDPSWSPDGSQIAYLYYQGADAYVEIHVLDLQSKDIQRITTKSEFPNLSAGWGLDWSPDGNSLFFSSEGNIYSIGLASGSDPNLIFSGERFTENPVWRP